MGNPKSAETPAMQSDRKPQLCWERPPFRMPGNWCHPWPASANPGLSGMRSCATVEELRGAGVSPPRAQPAPARGCPKASQQTDRPTESEIRGAQHPDLSTVKHRNRCAAFHPYELAVGILIVARNVLLIAWRLRGPRAPRTLSRRCQHLTPRLGRSGVTPIGLPSCEQQGSCQVPSA
jgi:hypothetical protein